MRAPFPSKYHHFHFFSIPSPFVPSFPAHRNITTEQRSEGPATAKAAAAHGATLIPPLASSHVLLLLFNWLSETKLRAELPLSPPHPPLSCASVNALNEYLLVSTTAFCSREKLCLENFPPEANKQTTQLPFAPFVRCTSCVHGARCDTACDKLHKPATIRSVCCGGMWT